MYVWCSFITPCPGSFHFCPSTVNLITLSTSLPKGEPTLSSHVLLPTHSRLVDFKRRYNATRMDTQFKVV